jgi:hypothetical protein
MNTGKHNRNLRASSAGGLVFLLVLAGSIQVVAAPRIVTTSPVPGDPAWEGAVGLSLDGVYGDMIEALLPVAIICAVSLVCTAVWLLAAGVHLRSRDSHPA